MEDILWSRSTVKIFIVLQSADTDHTGYLKVIQIPVYTIDRQHIFV